MDDGGIGVLTHSVKDSAGAISHWLPLVLGRYHGLTSVRPWYLPRRRYIGYIGNIFRMKLIIVLWRIILYQQLSLIDS